MVKAEIMPATALFQGAKVGKSVSLSTYGRFMTYYINIISRPGRSQGQGLLYNHRCQKLFSEWGSFLSFVNTATTSKQLEIVQTVINKPAAVADPSQCKIHPSSKIIVTFKPIMLFRLKKIKRCNIVYFMVGSRRGRVPKKNGNLSTFCG